MTAKKKREVKKAAGQRRLDLVILAPALPDEDDAWALPSLGLVVTDEQHRFGRATPLVSKG